MGLFDKIFRGSTGSPQGFSGPKEQKTLPWIPLTSVTQLDEIVERSKIKTQVIFKHSTTCGISRMVMRQFVASYDVDADLDLYYLDLHNYREVSNEAGYKFQVIHESPQLLILKNGAVVKYANHGDINEVYLETFF